MRFLPQTRNLLVGNANGDVAMAVLEDVRRGNFKVSICRIVQNVGFAVNDIQLSCREALDVWLVAAKNGKIMVWSRKSLRRNVTPAEELARIYELEYYLTDNFKIQRIQPASMGAAQNTNNNTMGQIQQ